MAEANNPAQPLQQLLIQSFEKLSEEELDEELDKVSNEDIRKVAKHLRKQLLAAKREVAELKTQLIEKDNNEIAYRKEIDELRRKQEGLQTYIEKLEKLIELLGRSVGELQSQVEDLKNDPQHTLAQTALDVALENRVRSDIHSVSLTEILQRLCRLESVQERNEDCRDYEQQDAGRREGPFLSQSGPETGPQTPHPDQTRGSSSNITGSPSYQHNQQRYPSQTPGHVTSDQLVYLAPAASGTGDGSDDPRTEYCSYKRQEEDITKTEFHYQSTRVSFTATQTRVKRTTTQHSTNTSGRSSSDSGLGSIVPVSPSDVAPAGHFVSQQVEVSRGTDNVQGNGHINNADHHTSTDSTDSGIQHTSDRGGTD